MGDLSWLTARPVAHRGLHDVARGIIENAGAAMDAAIAAGYAIELDLQASAEGEAMVFHDFTLDRLTDARGPLADRPAAELGAITFRGTGDRILTLPQLLERVAGRVPLIIEIKSAFAGDTRLAARAADLVAAYPGPAALMSFDPRMLEEVRARAPGVVRGIVAEGHYGPDWPSIGPARGFILANLLHWPRSRFQFVNYRVADLDKAAVRLLRTLGMPVLTWTVRTQDQRARAARYADQIVFEGFRP
ncbi:glycerophosphodiester phosphodiesterase family protein [Xanthobacter autotrophicus]|uniref:glycerophosphodiester phosphodiesterase family protein n=1 Tax=Xanthobacter autotrophicus TaxID=280 RepID=UPI0024A64360|nr:glycerophosphodiester phosphodiesterase family protein [Xanthobacter autotrophicus]MDI4655510.1 glycerophosphodiester phosphodiesterase [Xanthobacter autotrophicus]